MHQDDILPDGSVRVTLYRQNGSICGHTIVDAADVDMVKQYRWRLVGNRYWQRTQRLRGQKVSFYLHRVILGLTLGDRREADHINRNTFDNRRTNLRIVTHAQQMHNVSSHRDAVSAYRGVALIRATGRWTASVQIQGERTYVGVFSTEEEAAAAAKAARARLLPYAVD